MLIAAILLAAAAAPTIDHQPVDCVLKEHFAQFDAVLKPQDDNAKLRLFFKSAQDPDYYFEDMALAQGRFFARLPKPKERAGPITYYIEAVTMTGQLLRTPESTAQVVLRPDLCAQGGKL